MPGSCEQLVQGGLSLAEPFTPLPRANPHLPGKEGGREVGREGGEGGWRKRGRDKTKMGASPPELASREWGKGPVCWPRKA